MDNTETASLSPNRISTGLADRSCRSAVLARLAALEHGRLRDEHARDPERRSEAFARRIDELCRSRVAIETDAANEQHYAVPARE